jgi:hypothetical protein
MDDELQLISDGDGLAVIGDPAAVERFLSSEGLTSKELELPKVGLILGTASGAAQAGSGLAANSARWVQLTQESTQLIEKYGLMTSTKSGLDLGVVQSAGGQIKGIVQFTKSSSSFVTNPAVLSGAAGIMSQLAMQAAMDEINDYLATIDEKVDDLLRAQKDSVLADMIGVELVIDEAMIIRDQVGRVSDVTWSKVQATSMTVNSTQTYALRQLDSIAEKMERKSKIADVAKTAKESEPKVREWLAVLARCFQLQDALAILELDRVLDSSPEELDQHRMGLKITRQKRLDLIARSTGTLMARMDAAASRANAKVLLQPGPSRAVVNSSNEVVTGVLDLQGRLGIERSQEALEAKGWLQAAAEVRDKVIETGADGVDAAGRLGNETFNRARSMTDNVAIKLAERAHRRREDAQEADEINEKVD